MVYTKSSRARPPASEKQPPSVIKSPALLKTKHPVAHETLKNQQPTKVTAVGVPVSIPHLNTRTATKGVWRIIDGVNDEQTLVEIENVLIHPRPEIRQHYGFLNDAECKMVIELGMDNLKRATIGIAEHHAKVW